MPSQHSLLSYRLLNVFVSEPVLTANALAGNPLCVFEDGRGLDMARMMALTRQFNLSETTFILPPPADHGATATVRIFTPSSDPTLAEMPFAGHPSLGTAHVLRDLHGTGDEVVLQVPAGRVPVSASGDVWTLTAPAPGAPTLRAEPLGRVAVAALLGLSADDVAGDPIWVNAGTEQLLLPLASVDALERAAPVVAAAAWPTSQRGSRNCYVFARPEQDGGGGRQRIRSRFFMCAAGTNQIFEDPGTGSACANLGGWLLGQRQGAVGTVTAPALAQAAQGAQFAIDQGVEMQRPCRLLLDIGSNGRVRVGGRVMEIARGRLTLPG